MTEPTNRIAFSGLRLPSSLSAIKRRYAILAGAAALAAVLTGLAYFLFREPAIDPVRLRAALDGFTGEWEGDSSIQISDTTSPQMLRATRRYFWVGDRQMVETHLALDAGEQVTHTMQWIEDGRLRATETRSDDRTEDYSGALTSDGILWTNLHRPKSDRLDRLVIENGRRTVRAASIMPVRFGDVAGPVRVAAVLTPREATHSPGPAVVAPELEAANSRVTELERRLAAMEQERNALRAQLARVEAAVARKSAAADAPPTMSRPTGGAGRESRPSRLEIRTSPPGMKFEVRAEDGSYAISPVALADGTTPITLSSVPPGDYAVILQRGDEARTLHHVSVEPDRDVFLFHREDRATGPESP